MELKPIYKQTEVGVVPKDWNVENLGQRVTFRTGPFGTALHKSDYTDNGIPIVNPMHIINGCIVPSATMTITKEAADNLSEYKLKSGDVVIGRRGDMGRCAVVKKDEVGWLCGTGSMIIRCSERVVPNFLQLVLSDARAIAAIENASVGSTMVNLNQGVLQGLKIQFPPLPEQRAIAAALSDTDALLSSLDRLLAKKRDIKQAVMQQLLTGKQRLPGFSGEWEVKRLGEISEIVSGGTPKTGIPGYWDGGINWCTPTDITGTDGKYLFSTERTISALGLSQSSATLLPVGTLLLCSRATIGEIKIAATEVSTNQGFKALVCGPSVDNNYLYYLLLTMKPKMLEQAIGSTFLEISKAATAALEILLPSLSEQTAIAGVLSDMDAEIDALQERRNKTRATKQGMMQELLTGRTRLV